MEGEDDGGLLAELAGGGDAQLADFLAGSDEGGFERAELGRDEGRVDLAARNPVLLGVEDKRRADCDPG